MVTVVNARLVTAVKTAPLISMSVNQILARMVEDVQMESTVTRVFAYQATQDRTVVSISMIVLEIHARMEEHA